MVTVTNLGNASHSGAATSLHMTCAAAVAAGTPVVVITQDAGAAPFEPINEYNNFAVTDSKNNSYTFLQNTGNNSSRNDNAAIYYSFITTALTTSDNISYYTMNGTTFQKIAAISIPGFGALDPAISNGNLNAFAASYTVTAKGTAAVSGEMNIGFASFNSVVPNLPTTGWTGCGSWSNTSAIWAFQVNQGTAPLTFNGTASGSQWGNGQIFAFQPIPTILIPQACL